MSGQVGQPVPLASLKLSMAVNGQELATFQMNDHKLTPPSFGRDVKVGVLCLDAACIVGLN